MDLVDRLVCECIGIIRNDFQFDKSNDRYLGFINIEPCNSGEYTLGFMTLAEYYKKYESILNASGLYFEGIPNKDEMIITNKKV
jgi:ABC-type molybdate transport system substrate-binding protein